MAKTRVGILGYGNVGRGIEAAVNDAPDQELVAIFTRRDPATVHGANSSVPVVSINDIDAWKDKVDVLLLGGGSATDLPVQGPEYAAKFNIVDSFDTHANIPQYFDAIDKAGKGGGKVGIIATGWDPGFLSVLRVYNDSFLPNGHSTTFWGPGVSQGHSDAIRRIPGVKRGVEYTMPYDEAMNKARNGEGAGLTTREKHHRVNYVVAEDGADHAAIEKAIKEMPNYFADYNTTVSFITDAEFDADHAEMPHAGTVIHHGVTGDGTEHVIDTKLTLESNPEFTGAIMSAYARAAHRLAQEGKTGAFTVFDIAPAQLSPKSGADLRKTML